MKVQDWVILLVMSACHLSASCYDPGCIQRCDNGEALVVGAEGEQFCPITMPDNPYRQGSTREGSIVPCQIEIQANCSNYCHIELQFNKFELDSCNQNITNTSATCHMVDSCEYILLHDKGNDLDGSQIDEVTQFHGNNTDVTYESTSDRVVIQFCYRSETFSARNIQVTYRLIDPTIVPPVYLGPASVYILSAVVLFFCVCICIIKWFPPVQRCLDPPGDTKADEELL